MVKTRRMKWGGDWVKRKCEFCARRASYWSQNEGPKGKRLGRIVWHCQTHRKQARDVAARE